MSTLSDFFAENLLPAEHVKFPATTRLLDKNKKPLLWEIRPISAEEDAAIRKDCMKRVPIPGRKNQYQAELDATKYLGRLAVACTVFPDLNSAELQNTYHVMGGDVLLRTILFGGEYDNYLRKVQEVCGFNTTLQEDVDEAKN